MKKLTLYLLLFTGCVTPPDYKDGLLENIPAVVNNIDYFSLSVNGDDFSEEHEWELSLATDTTDSILTTLILSDVKISNSDSTLLLMMNDSGDTIFQTYLLSNIVWTSTNSISGIGSPRKISLLGDNFTGRLEYQIIKTP